MKKPAALILFLAAGLFAQEPPPSQEGAGRTQDPMSSGTFTGFRLRAIGPALMSGRIGTIAIHPANKQTWIIAVASGGVWRTTNAGTTWSPIFQNEGAYSIGEVVIDPRNPATLWVGTGEANNQRSVGYGDGVYRGDDRGNSWTAVSPDLTRQIDRNLLPVMGRIWPPESVAKHQSTATYGNISAVSESRKKEGLIYVGTDDGLVHVTEDGGKNWRKLEKFPGLPEYNPYGVYVQRIYASKHDQNTVYVLFDNHKNGDFKPYIYKSTDKGVTWTSVSGDLPANGPSLSLAEDHINPQLHFCGTEFGLFFTVDGGKKWLRLRSNLPTIPVRDLAIQERENDLAPATFGRGFYLLDDYSPLRDTKPEVFNKDAHIFTAKKAMIQVADSGKNRGSQGEQHWMAENPTMGAVITYWVKETPRTAKQMRQEAARAAEQKKEVPKYPSPADLTAEADEEAPQTIMTVTDSAGNLKTRITAIRRALVDSPADLKLLDEAVKLDQRITAIQRKFRGNETLRGLESGSPSSISSRVNNAVAGARTLAGKPTGTQEMNCRIALEEFSEEQATLKAVEADLKKFEQQLDAAGVPLTPGRYPEIR